MRQMTMEIHERKTNTMKVINKPDKNKFHGRDVDIKCLVGAIIK